MLHRYHLSAFRSKTPCMEDVIVNLVVGTMVASVGIVMFLTKLRRDENEITDEIPASEGWSALPPPDAIRLKESAFEVWAWSRSRHQRVVETRGEITYETEEAVGYDVNVAVRCPQEPTKGLLAPIDAHLSQHALYRFGLLWIEQPAAEIDATLGQLEARLVSVALCRTQGDAALPELCRRARPGQPGSARLAIPLLALETEDDALETLASQWAVSGVFRTLIGTNRHHAPIMSKVALRMLNAVDTGRDEMLLALLRNGQPMLLEVAINALRRWPQEGGQIQPNHIVECSHNLYDAQAIKLLCRFCAALPSERAQAMLQRLIQAGTAEVILYAAEELAGLDIDATVTALLQRTNGNSYITPEIAATVITSLGRYAGVDVVMHIRELSDGMLTTEEVKIAAENAITYIQERASAEGGRVSLVTDAFGGEVSVATPDMVDTSPSE